jgi:hypothetical protein
MDSTSPQNVSPVLAAFLLNNCKATEGVFVRAVLSLVEEGWLQIVPQDEAETNGMTLVRIGRTPDPDQVEPAEKLVLERVLARLGRHPSIPLSVLTSNEGQEYEAWRLRFERAVADAAGRAGLIGRRVRRGTGCGLLLVLPAAVGVGANIADSALQHPPHPATAATAAALVAFFGALMVVGRLFRWRPTEYGLAVTAWWREHGGGIGGAVITDRLPADVLEPTGTAQALVARGSEPLPPDQVWSSLGGRWRPVRVGSIRVPVWGRPATAWAVTVLAVFFTIPATVVGRVLVGGATGELISAIPAACLVATLLGAWLPANLRRRHLPTGRTFTGQIVKRWSFEKGTGEDKETVYCCCIDDGESAEGWSFSIPLSEYRRIRVGNLVTVEVNVRWHKLTRITASAEPPQLPGQYLNPQI